MNKKKVLFILNFFFLTFSLYPLDSPRDHYRQGEEALVKQEYYLAVQEFKKALELNPSYYEALKGLVEAFYRLGEQEEALSFLESAKKLKARDTELLNLEGMILIEQEKLEEARKVFDFILTLEPRNLQARFGLAELDIIQGRSRQGARTYEEALKAAPGHKGALLQLVKIYNNLKEYKSAEFYLEMALKYHASDPQVHMAAGEYWFSRKNTAAALKHFTTAIALKPDYYHALHMVGKIKIFEKKYDEGINILRQALGQEDEYVRSLIRYTIGRAYEEQGNTEEAFKNYNLALGLRYEDEITRISAEDLALRNLKDKDTLRRELGDYHFRNAGNYMDRNYLRQAGKEFRRTLQLYPDYTEARIAYAGIFKTLGFPLKYYYTFRVLQDYYQIKDTRIVDEIKLLEGNLYDTLTAEWSRTFFTVLNEKPEEDVYNQYKITKSPYLLGIYTIPEENSLIHPLAESALTGYFASLFLRYENIHQVNEEFIMSGYDEALKQARTAGADYYVILNFKEQERGFETEAVLYLARTGGELKRFSLYRTGNFRVDSTFYSLTESLYNLFPLKGRLVTRKFNRGIINLGQVDGIKKDDTFVIIKKGQLKPDHNQVGYIYSQEDLLGKFIITRVDENIAEGRIEKNSFFDFINPLDELLFLPPEEKKSE